MNTTLEKISAFFRSLIPTRILTRYDRRQDPPSLAQEMTPDRVHGILRLAEAGDCSQLFALYRDIILNDSHLQGRLGDRKEAVLGDTLSIQPRDKNSADDMLAAKLVEDQVKFLPGFEDACVHLLDSTLYPVAVLEKVYRPVFGGPVAFTLAALIPVDAQLLRFTTGKLQIADTDPESGSPLGSAHDPDPARYIVHRGHLLTAVDNWGGPMRSLVFWWLLGTMSREWWARFLDRYGAPFLVGKFDQADDASRSILERAFSLSVKIGGLVVSRETEIEMLKAATSDSGDAFEKFKRFCNDEISKLILGESLSSDARATGMNSGNAGIQENKRLKKSRLDARRLGATFAIQLGEQILRINGFRGKPPLFAWGSVSIEEAQAIGELVGNLSGAGIAPTEDALQILSDRVGFMLERKVDPMAAVAPGVLPLSAPAFMAMKPQVAIVGKGGAELPRRLRGALAPVSQIILQSRTPEEAMARVEAFCATLPSGQAEEVLQAALAAISANGVAMWVKSK